MKERDLYQVEDKLKNQIFNLANIYNTLCKNVDLNKEFGNLHKSSVGAVLESLKGSRQIIKDNCDKLTQLRLQLFQPKDYEEDYLFELNAKRFTAINSCFVVMQEFAWYNKGDFQPCNSPEIFTSFNKAKEFVEKMTVGTVLLNREKKTNDFVYRVVANKDNEKLTRYTIYERKLNDK